MHQIRQILTWIVLLTLLAGCATQQERAERRAQTRKAVNEAVEKRQWHIDVTMMRPMRYTSRMVSSDFYLELRNDTLRSYLPYLGQVHWTPMIYPSIGLNFEQPILSYQHIHHKEHIHQIDMVVRTEEDAYHYEIEIYDNGEADIRVRSNNRDPISFEGNVNEADAVQQP